jgi:hypothetical protein
MTTTGRAPVAASSRDRAAIVAGCFAVAAAAWLWPASVHIVRWTVQGPTRVGLFASRSLLVWLLAGAALASVASLAWTWRNPQRLARVAAHVGPLTLLWVCVVPYLPWLPDRLPLLLVLAGPLRWAIAGIAVAGAVDLPTRVAALIRVVPLPGRRFVFAASLALYIACGLRITSMFGPGGDEPHYLMIAQSILSDRDLLIENNHQLQQYRSFYGGDLRPDFMARGKDGQIYSIHAPGLPVILLPSYAAAGYTGALLMMCLMAALTALAVFDLSESLAGRGAALFAWLAACLSIPFVPNAWMIYPEIAGALIVAWAALWVWNPQPERTGLWLLRGIVLAMLPWLHTKFAIFLGLFGLALAFQARRHVRALAAIALPVAMSLAGWFYYFYAVYGAFNPEAPYGDYTSLHVLMRNLPRSFLGLLFDQKFGLLFYSPVYLVAIAGWWTMVRRREQRYLALVLLTVFAAFMVTTARLYMWWGGSSPPARFLVPLVPCLAPMIACAVHRLRGNAARSIVGIWLAIGLGVASTAVLFPEQRFFFNDPHGFGRLLETIQASAPFAITYPTFTTEDWRTPFAMLVPWVAAALATLVAIAAASRLGRERSPLWLGTFGSLAFLVVAGAATARPAPAIRAETARRSALDIIWQWDPNRRAFDYERRERVDPARLRELSVVSIPGVGRVPVPLPAGAYDARIWFAGAGARQGEIAVRFHRGLFGRYAGPLQNPAIVPFDLPASVDAVSIGVQDEALARQVVSTDIVPRAIVPVPDRDPRRVRSVDAISGSDAGYIAYVDDAAFPEGGVFWTRGTDPVTVLIGTGGASRVVLTLSLGPLNGDVRLTAAGRESSVRVPANDTVDFTIDVPSGARVVPVTINSPGQFRPTQFDPNARDSRRLGCNVRVRLQ